MKKIETLLIHAGEPRPRIEGAIVAPVFQSAMFEYQDGQKYDDLTYIRLNNTPNHRIIHAKLAALEGGEAAVVTASGMAAISTSLFTTLRAGDHLIAQSCLYGGTQTFFQDELPRHGIDVSFVDGDDASAWKSALRKNTRAVYAEAISNPLCDVADHEGIVRFAKEHELVSFIDNTFASPVNFRPLALGYDVSLHSATKYLNGHSDLVAGVAVSSAERIGKMIHTLNHLGGSLQPSDIFLLHRGLKTLALRVERQNHNAMTLASHLARHPAVKVVHYPGLETHPRHARARALFHGFGGVLSFELDADVAAADRFLSNLELAARAPSLGGVETLASRPAAASHSGLSPEARAKLGLTDTLIRLAVGIEAVDDLLADITQALQGTGS